MRKHWQSLSCCILLILVSSSASTLDHMCKYVATTRKDIGYDYCIKFFQADKASATANNRGLGVATQISRAAASDTLKRIDTLMASDKDKKIHARLLTKPDPRIASLGRHGGDCAAAPYASLPQSLPSAGARVAVNLNAVVLDTYTCENGFRVLGVNSPLAAEDAKFLKDCSIALNITVLWDLHDVLLICKGTYI
ncbi:hypothetical protein VPH35_114117 [Triticum aestivum]